MKTPLKLLLFSFVIWASCFGQSASAKWQVAAITGVKAQPLGPGQNTDAIRYDVTVRVGNIEYVVLYVPPEGSFKEGVKYQLGIDHLVLVGADTIRYNDMLGRIHEVPIISRRPIAAQNAQKIEKQ